jgi:hypothetical protein
MEDDPIKMLLLKLRAEHPNASQSELFNLLTEASKNDEKVKRAISKFWMTRKDKH